jgi:hypothetical protein
VIPASAGIDPALTAVIAAKAHPREAKRSPLQTPAPSPLFPEFLWRESANGMSGIFAARRMPKVCPKHEPVDLAAGPNRAGKDPGQPVR